MTKVTVEIEDVIGQFQSLGDEIKRLRTALEYIVEYCEETSLSRDDKIAHTLRKARSALEGKNDG